MKGIKLWTLFLAASLLVGCSHEKVIVRYDEASGNRVEFAAEMLRSALEAKGYQVEMLTPTSTNNDETTPHIINLSLPTTIDSTSGESLPKEGFTINTIGNCTTVCGNDGSGVIYGCRELIDRMEQSGRLDCPDHLTDAPEMVLRGTCIGVQKPYTLPGRLVYEYPYTPELFPWLYDKALWVEYLDMLVANRMNSVYLWNGHPFASLVKLEDYPFAVEVDDETFRKNKDLFSFLTEEADKRGIFVIQMFYNVIVSQPFAEHYGIKTQDRHRPLNDLLSDYTRKSVAAFIEEYPNVGLLVCLGEAMDTYEDDVEWFTQTILPGVKDGLAASGRTDEPPVLLRAHDTDCKLVIDAAQPIYKNLYTMQKYNGESLTTYQPRGPSAEQQRQLSELNSVHISNVHILANLEPFRWGAPDFVRKSVIAMHDIHGANALHLYPQASYWDWPYTADSIAGGRERQIDRDWPWYEMWGRYAWNCRRDPEQESDHWAHVFGKYYGLSDADGALIRNAYDEAGEIAPKLTRRFGMTEGNRQTLLLGMFASQLVNPYKYGVWEDLYESCGPEGEKLIEYVEKEWKGEPHVVGDLPLDIVQQCIEHADKAVAAIDAVGRAKANNEELKRLKNDMHCYREFAYSFYYKVKAAEQVLNYHWGKDLACLDAALPLLEKSLEHYRKLAELTQDTYLYANSMQTRQRRIPIGGDDGKNKHWTELLPYYERELANFRANVATLRGKADGSLDVSETLVQAAHDAEATLEGDKQRVKLTVGAKLMADRPENGVEELAPELEGLTAIVVNGKKQRDKGTLVVFECREPVKLLVAYFKDDGAQYAQVPNLETDATANDFGQAEPVLTNAIHLQGMPVADVHAYHFEAGKHALQLPKGYVLLLGLTDSEIATRDVALAGSTQTADWLFY